MINSLKFLPKDFTTLRFALNLLFQDTSCSLALKYSNFLFKFFSFAFYHINFWFKINKICPKISHFSQIFHFRGNTGSVYFTGIRLPFFDFQTLRSIFQLLNHVFCTRGTGKRLPKFENQSRGAGYASQSLIIKVGESKARLQEFEGNRKHDYDSLKIKVGEPKAQLCYALTPTNNSLAP